MPDATAPAFGDLLRAFRRAAGLSQEALAEAAGVSRRAVSDLERGPRRAPYPDTLRRLAAALRLDDADRARLGAAATRPHRAPSARPPALPADVSGFVGRERERADLAALLPTTRLLTLTGAGGVGKTRLALAAARAVAPDYPDGVWLVELAALADPDLVPRVVAGVLGVTEQPGRPPTETLAGWLVGRRLLLVLDNCEHLLGACARLADALLRAGAGLRVLATSRERLRVAGEVAWRVPSLAAPPIRPGDPAPGAILAPARLATYDAIRLFVRRAREADPGFALGPGNAPAVARICAGLDGIPLALELAAARLPALTVEQLAARLDDRFRLLTGGSRAAPPRQRTLRATLDWSHELLTAPEQVVFRRLAVFAGGWNLEAAEAVCASDGVEAADALDLLARLVATSLAQVEERDGEARYWLLETVRQYAAERLEETGEAAAVRERHAAWCLALAEQAEPALLAPGHAGWLARLEAEHDNLRAALAWCAAARPAGRAAAGGPPGRLLDGAVALRRGQAPAARGAGAGARPTSERVAALLAAARLARNEPDRPAARAWCEEALADSRALGEADLLAEALAERGALGYFVGEVGPARAVLEEGVALSRASGNRHSLGVCLFYLGWLAEAQADYGRARALLEEALALGPAVGSINQVGHTLRVLGLVALHQGDIGRARALVEESLAAARRVGSPQGVENGLEALGRIAAWEGDLERADRLYEAGRVQTRAAGFGHGGDFTLIEMGQVARRRGDLARAARLVEGSRQQLEAMEHRRGIAAALHVLGLVALDAGDGTRATERLRDSLTLRREMGERLGVAEGLEGLALVAAGMGEHERAARLVGAAAALREAIGAPLPPVERPDQEATISAARAALGADGFAAAWAAGRTLASEEAVAEALADGPEPAAT